MCDTNECRLAFANLTDELRDVDNQGEMQLSEDTMRINAGLENACLNVKNTS